MGNLVLVIGYLNVYLRLTLYVIFSILNLALTYIHMFIGTRIK